MDIYFGFRPFPLTWQQREDVAAFAAILDAAERGSRELDAHLVLAFAPAKYRVYQDLCTVDPANPVADWQLGDLPQRLAQEASRRQIEFVDLTPALRAEARRGRLVYHPDDTHWNAAGNRAAGIALAAALRQRLP